MIAHLRGTLTIKNPDHVILDVHGVGYRVFIPLSTYNILPTIGDPVHLLTITLVREDAFHLYGFSTPIERELFLLLNTVTGIGAKLALAALSDLGPERLISALSQSDVRTLSLISGVGQKTAQRLILELKDRLPHASLTPTPPSPTTPTQNVIQREDLASALLNLGYKRPQVDHALRQPTVKESTDLTTALRAALKVLGTA